MISRQRKRRNYHKKIYQTKTENTEDNNMINDDHENTQASNIINDNQDDNDKAADAQNNKEKHRWSIRKDEVNLKRRQSYQKSPSPIRRRVREAYQKSPSPIRRRVREAYQKSPSPIRRRVREAYQKSPSPIRRRVREAYQKSPSPIRRRVREAYQKSPSPIRRRVREAYQKSPSPIRRRVREAYQKSPSPIRHRVRKAYKKNPSPIRHRVRKAYKKNPSPIRHRVREAYKKDPSPVRHRVKHAYNQNATDVKKRIREFYQSNPSPKRRRTRLVYAANPSPIKKRVLRRYHDHPSPCKERSKKAYHSNVAASRSLRRKRYAEDPLPALKRSRLYYKKHQDDVLKRSMHRRHTASAALAIWNKYDRIFHRKFGQYGTFSEYVQKVHRKLILQKKKSNKLEAQLLVRSCLQQLSLNKHKFITSIDRLQNMVKSSVVKATEVATTDLEVLDIFCGGSLHTINTELYNCGACYYPEALNDDGILDLEKFPSTQINYIGDKCVATWECCLDPPLCKLDAEEILTKLRSIYSKIIDCSANAIRKYMRHIDDCSNSALRLDESLQGHPLECYLSLPPCTSEFLYLRILAPHFPAIRRLVMAIYDVRRYDRRISEIEYALRYGHLDKILEIVKEACTTRMRQYDVSAKVLDEKRIYETYDEAFSKFNERCEDVAKYPCISCDKLCFVRDCLQVDRLIVVPSNRHWKNLLEFNETRPEFDDNLPNGYICDYCIEYFRSDRLPPRCILNGLDFGGVVPEEIRLLNTYEKVLIQRAKCFQTVTRMGTVAKKHLPSTHKIQKVHGTTFHLPLPLEETLKKLPEPHQPLADTSELYILLRSIPTKSKIIWQDLVDVHKVYRALQKLKEINHLYSAIVMPGQPHELQLERQIEEFSATSEDAMIQQIAENEEAALYEQYTINALHAPRMNERATALYQLLKVNEAPLDNRTKYLDMYCFPDLYPHGIGGQTSHREVLLQPAEYVKCILMSRDSRFRLNQQFIFYLLHQATMRQIASGIYHKLKVTRPKEKLTAAQCLQLLSRDELEGNLTTIFSRLRNTEQFWIRPRNDLNCMVFHYGPATWFITLSPGEWLWEDLGAYLRELNPEMCDSTISALVVADPVSTSRFIDNKFKAVLDFLLVDKVPVEERPLGNVIHYCVRREYQGRGLQHFHLQLWVKDAPLIGERTTDEDEICTFIAKYATCEIPDPTLCPTLYERVMRFQQHKCNDYCLRSKKMKTGFRKACRFGFPRPQREKMHLRSVVEAVAGRKCLKANSRLYDLPRKSNAIRINDYNPAILLAWEGNMDIQYIGENSAILNWYCTKYTTKAEKSHSVQVFDDITSTKSLASRLWNVALRSLSHRECGALEAADTLLGISLFKTDKNTTIRWVDVNMVRSRKLKNRATIEALDDESLDIFFPSWVDTYYPNRIEEIEDMHLYDFLSWHDWDRKEPGKNTMYYPFMGGFLKKRERQYLINHYKYSVSEEPEKYYYALLLLFKPWRDCESLLGGYETYAEAFHSFSSESVDAINYHNRLQQQQNRDKTIRTQIDKCRTQMEAEEQNSSQEAHENDPLLHGITEAQEAMADFEAALIDHDDTNVDAMIENLNEDQLRVFNKVRNSVHAQCLTSQADNTEPLRMFISGCGGTGKSYLIKTIKAWVSSTTDKHVAVTAPTGIAAFNINGLTIHRLLQLPVEHGKTPHYRPLSDDSLKIVRQRLHNLTLLIIDEISMVSHITLLYIHLRLTEIFQTEDMENGWFGCKNILVFGDLLQLPPVFESPVYIPLTSTIVNKHAGSVGGADIWSQLFSYDELTINMRQKEHGEFIELLGRVRLGALTVNDIKMLSSCKIPLKSDTVNGRMKEIVAKLAELPEDTVCLLPTRHMCEQINAEVLKGLTGEQYSIVAEDSVDCSATLLQKVKQKLAKYSEDCTHTAGLENVITVKVGCKVMLRRNIDVTLGLVNGAIGTICSVQRCIDHANKVDTLTIMFGNDQEHRLKRVTTKFEVFDKVYVIRSQFPITTAYAITIHKSQGLTLNHVLTDIGNTVFTCGQAYVALSRVKSIEGLHLINFDPRSIKALDSAILEYNRLRQEFRSNLQQFDLPKRCPKAISDRQWCTIRSASTVQEPVNQPAQNVTFKGFVNSDSVSSYANSVMQCLLLSPAVRQAMMQSTSTALKDMCVAYTSMAECNLDCLQLRQELGAPYNGPHVQSPIAFLKALVQQTSHLNSALQHTVRMHIHCTHCNVTSFTENRQHMIPLTVPTSVKTLKLTKLMETYLDWTQLTDKFCDVCEHPIKVRTEIVSASHVLILQLDVWTSIDDNTIKRKANITSIPDSSITIGSSTYKFMSAVSLLPSTRPSCHYMAILSIRGRRWLHLQDLSASTAPWPRGGKDVLMLFYHLKDTVASVKTATGKESCRRDAEHSNTASAQTIFARSHRMKTTTTSVSTAATTTTPTTTTYTTGTCTTRTEPTTATTTTANTPSTSAAGRGTSGSTSLTFNKCKGFTNNDGVSCYANSTLQCLLQHRSVRNACVGSRYTALRDLANDYVDPTKVGYLSSRSVRKLLRAPFSVNRQQDAAEFLQALAMFCTPVNNCLQHTITTYLRCSNCTYTSSRQEDHIILPLVIPADSATVRLHDLVTKLSDWETMLGSHCSACNTDGAVYQTRQELVRASELIVIQLKLYVIGGDGIPHKLRVSVDDVTSSTISVQGQYYKVHNIVSHHGPSALSGHYTSYHKQNRGWTLVNDHHLTRTLEPETNNDVYILFYAKQPPDHH